MNDPDLPDSADAPEPAEPHPTARRSPALIAVAVALPVALVVGVLVAAVIAGRDPIREPVALGTVPAPAAESPECAALIADLPENLGDFERAELMDPAPSARPLGRRTTPKRSCFAVGSTARSSSTRHRR
ncbi:hypothetical protein BTZ20_2119 [Rhodococcus sp. MTM3W5.2]|nr:hypothetical protein BTZ20_2119 [Rhodococcus sp. MTM3W5.2]